MKYLLIRSLLISILVLTTSSISHAGWSLFGTNIKSIPNAELCKKVTYGFGNKKKFTTDQSKTFH